MAGKHKISKKKIILISLLCAVTALIIGMSIISARGEMYIYGPSSGVTSFGITISGDTDNENPHKVIKFNKEDARNRTYYRINDNVDGDRGRAVTASSDGTYGTGSNMSDASCYYIKSRLMLGTVFQVNGGQKYTSLFVKEDGGTPENIYMAVNQYVSNGESYSDIAKNLKLAHAGYWKNSYETQTTRDTTSYVTFRFRYDNGDPSSGAGQDTRIGWNGANKEDGMLYVDLADYKYKYIIFNPFVYKVTADKGFTDTTEKSVVIKRWGLENVYDQIVDRENKVGADFIGWSVKSSSGYVFDTTATTGKKASEIKKYLDGSCFQEAAFKNLTFTALYATPPDETETESDPPSTEKQYDVVTNYFFFKSDGSWSLNDIIPAKHDTGYEGNYYEIDAPEVPGYAMRKGYYNPHDISEFIEKDGETLCDWMVNNDCITFAVLYQQPCYMRTWHFTQENGSFVHHLDWDYLKEVAPGGIYKVDMTSRGPYDLILAGKYTGDPDNPVETEQYAFTVDSSMDVALIYKKIRAAYTIEHYKQNIYDDGYTLADTEKDIYGTIGEMPDYSYKSYKGFTENKSLAVIPGAISEDDSTVVKLYYDRNVHTVALDKTKGIDSLTGAGIYRYGQTVNINASVGPGYNWEKWEGLSANISESFTMPDNDLTYKACASPKSYIVTFIGNGGTADPLSRVVTYDSTDWNTGAVTAERKGYELDAWYTQANDVGGMPSGEKVFDADGNAVKGTCWSDNGSSAVWKGLSDLTVYARWLPKKYTLYFDYNVPSGADRNTLKNADTASKEVTYTEAVGDLPEPELAGYRLLGWYNSDDVGITKDTVYSIQGDSTVYAKWALCNYTIIYDTNYGTWNPNAPGNPYSANYYDAITIYAPVRNGYDFAGWNITDMDSYPHILDGSEPDTNTHAENIASGKTSAVFKGLRGDTGEVKFTAQWSETTFNIEYNLNGAIDPGNPKTYTVGTPDFPLINPSKEGYGFEGWTGTGLDVPNPAVVIAQGSTGNREYTANFTANKYRIEYVLDGGTAGAYAPDEAAYDSTVTISNPTKPGAVFAGWDITGMDGCTHTLGTATTTNSSATGIKATAYKNLRSTDGTVTFTAKWNYISYSVTYDFNGGRAADFGSYPPSVKTWNEFTVATPVHDSGYTFLGWTITGMDDGSHRYGGYTSNDSTLEGIKETEYENLRYSSGTVKFTAAWERPVRQVVFMSDGGEMKGESIQDGWTMRFIRFGDKLFTATNEYGINWGTDVPRADKTGYSFLGYYDSIDGGNQLYTVAYTKSPGLYWDTDGRWIGPSLIIYAQYTPRKYKIYYNLNGGVWADDGSSGERDVTVTYDSTDYNKYYGESDVYRKGYIFEGWYDAVTGGAQVYKTDGSCVGGSYWSTDYVE